ncbi:MAG: hypothetical protein AAFP18_04715 [Bacteroidota bacterium]
MRLTAEVRWIWPGPIPDDVQAWFDGLGDQPPIEKHRTDRYLVPTAPGGLNVKRRKGRLEIKRCAGIYGVEDLAVNVRGAVDIWTKWRFPLDDPDQRPDTDEWWDIEKHRLTRVFVLDRNTLREATSENAPDEGCDLELTRLVVQGKEYCSICFEGFDNDATSKADTQPLVNMLRLAIAFTMRHGPPRPLLADCSVSYADWLRTAVYGDE